MTVRWGGVRREFRKMSLPWPADSVALKENGKRVAWHRFFYKPGLAAIEDQFRLLTPFFSQRSDEHRIGSSIKADVAEHCQCR
jgi:hypothetical protein